MMMQVQQKLMKIKNVLFCNENKLLRLDSKKRIQLQEYIPFSSCNFYQNNDGSLTLELLTGTTRRQRLFLYRCSEKY
jgi:hypothetical protein